VSQAETLGLPAASLAFGGRSWPLRHDFWVEGLYSVHLRERAADFCADAGKRLGPDGLRLALREAALAAAAGEFDWESECCTRSWRAVGSRGWRHLCWLCLNRGDPAATPQLVDAVCDAGKAAELDAALAVALDPLGRGRAGSASPSAPSAPSWNGGATAGPTSPASTAATSPA
jgi:hypothetical protein